jgi:AcrR family transcriptional regulator
VYLYFPSIDDLLRAVLDDVLPDWTAAVNGRVNAATTPGTQAWAYVEANFALFSSPDHAVAQALGNMAPPLSLHSSLRTFHATLQEPLRRALAALGEPEPESMAAYIDALILYATHHQGVFEAGKHGIELELALARIRRLLSGYLQLPPIEQLDRPRR